MHVINRPVSKYMDASSSACGQAGFLNMNGNFSSHLDRKLEMNSDAYHAMNHQHQRKAVKEVLFKLENGSV